MNPSQAYDILQKMLKHNPEKVKSLIKDTQNTKNS